MRFVEDIYVLKELREEPLERMVEADPAVHDVEIYHFVRRIREIDVVERDAGEARRVASLVVDRRDH